MRAWGLSVREPEVACLVLDGLATEEIAAELYISGHTVRDHIRSVFDKVGVRSRRDLVRTLSSG
jgi:DNA-binding CsgD family transcriptional regulator